MPIELNTPVIVPAVTVPEKVADRIYIQHLSIMAEDPTQPVTCTIGVCPMVSATGELLREGQAQIVLGDVLTACQSNQTLGGALQAIYGAVGELCRQRGMYGLTPTEGQ
jgi:hypothetical protein